MFQQSELDRHIIKPAGREAAIEMPQSRNNDSDDWNIDVGARLIEDEEIKALALGDTNTGAHLFARVECAECRGGSRLDHRIVTWHQEGIVLQPQRRGAVKARFFSGSAAHEADRQELVEFRQRTQHGNARIEVRAGTELDIFLPVIDPVRYRHKSRDPEIAGDVEHPKPAAGVGKLVFQITDIGIVELAE